MGFFTDKFKEIFSGGSTANDNTGEVGSTYQGASGPGGMTGGEAFQSGVISAAERREQLLADAAAAQASGQDYSYNTDEFTGNNLGLSNTVSEGKLREGMTSPEYATFMQTLYGNNPGAMQQAFPFSSGATVGNLIKPIIGAASGLGGVAGLLPNLLSSVDKKLGGIFNQDKVPTDMGTSMSSMDQADLDALSGPSMLDISGPGTAATGFDNEADAIAASGFPASEYATAGIANPELMNASSLLNFEDLLNYNINGADVQSIINSFKDNKGFDVKDNQLQYNVPIGPGNLQFGAGQGNAGINFSLPFGA